MCDSEGNVPLGVCIPPNCAALGGLQCIRQPGSPYPVVVPANTLVHARRALPYHTVLYPAHGGQGARAPFTRVLRRFKCIGYGVLVKVNEECGWCCIIALRCSDGVLPREETPVSGGPANWPPRGPGPLRVPLAFPTLSMKSLHYTILGFIVYTTILPITYTPQWLSYKPIRIQTSPQVGGRCPPQDPKINIKFLAY